MWIVKSVCKFFSFLKSCISLRLQHYIGLSDT